MLPEKNIVEDKKEEERRREADQQRYLTEVSRREVSLQYTAHQPFLLSALDDEEELKSRVAFVDAYRKEFEQLHEELQARYGKRGDEFYYLKNPAFYQLEVFPKQCMPYPHLYLPDMMKDYLTYRYVLGDVGPEAYKEIFEGKPDKVFRTQAIIDGKEKWDFLIGLFGHRNAPESKTGQDNDISTSTSTNTNSAVSLTVDELSLQKLGLRDCRKWMYRDCTRSGPLNSTGHKRAYIDAFGKKPLAVQLDTLLLLQKQLSEKPNTVTALNASSKQGILLSLNNVMALLLYSGCLCLCKRLTGDAIEWERMVETQRLAEEKSKKEGTQEKEEAGLLIQRQSSREKEDEIKPTTNALDTFLRGYNVYSIIRGVLSTMTAIITGAYLICGGPEENKIYKKTDEVAAWVAIGASMLSVLYNLVLAAIRCCDKHRANRAKTNADACLSDERGQIRDMAQISAVRSNWNVIRHAVSAIFSAFWLAIAFPKHIKPEAMEKLLGHRYVPSALATAISVGDLFTALWLGHKADKKIAETAVDLTMKMDEKKLLEKVAKYKKSLDNKLKQRRLNPDLQKIAKEYLNSDAKLRDRAYEESAVKEGYASIYSVLFWQDVKHHIQALKYILLKDPKKALNDLVEDDLIKKKDFNQYFRRKKTENETGTISQPPEQLQTKLAYRDLLTSDDVKTGVAENFQEAWKRFGLSPSVSVSESATGHQMMNSEFPLMKP